VDEIKKLYQYTSGTAIVNLEGELWIVFSKDVADRIDKFILEEANKHNTHLVKYCHCKECAKQRRSME